MSQQQPLLPFSAGTRQRRQRIGSYAATIGQSLPPILVPSVGMAARLVAKVRGTVTYSGTGVLTDKGPWQLLNRVQVNVNIGSALVYDTSGYGNYILQKFVSQGWLPDQAGAGQTTPDVNVHQWPLSGTAQPFELTYVIPLNANTGMNLEQGLINLQSPEVQMYVNITMGQLTDAATLITGFPSLNVVLYYEYYEIGPTSTYALPPLMLVRTLEQTQPIAAVGDQVMVIPRLGVLLQAVQLVTLNGARSDSVDATRILFNQTDQVYFEERQWTKAIDRMLYGTNPIVGAFYHDFWDSLYPGLGAGDLRDAVNTELLAELDLIATVNSGASLGSGNNFYTVVRRVAQALYPISSAA